MTDSDRVYCTWAHRAILPPSLRGRFADLDQFIREVIASAERNVILIAPYLGGAGLQALAGAMGVAVGNGAWIRLVAGDLDADDQRNRRALDYLLESEQGRAVARRLRVLCPSSSLPVLLHAKAVVADGSRGYIGSANLSWHGMERNFEMGVALTARQAGAIAEFVQYLEATQRLQEVSQQQMRA